MGRVVVVVVLLLLFKTFTHISLVTGKEARYLERKCRKVVYEGMQHRKKFYTRSQQLCQTGLGNVSRLSSGLDPWISRDPTPKKVLYAKSGPMSDRSWRRQDFLRGWIPENQGIQPRRKFYTRSQHLCLTGLGKVSRISSGLDPRISRDPTPKKVLSAKSAPTVRPANKNSKQFQPL